MCAYENSLEGLIQYRKDIKQLKGSFPGLTILFAPEMGPGDDLTDVPSEVIEMSDYFICEPLHSEESMDDNTDSMIKRLHEALDFMKAVNKPVFMAHPFRSAVNNRLIKKEIQPWVTELRYRDHWTDFGYEELTEFFNFDIIEVAKAARDLDIPIEVNGNTQYRVRSANIPAVIQMLWAAYKVIADEGTELVPGSDLHGFKTSVGNIGQYIPYECFNELGIKCRDIKFLSRILPHNVLAAI